MSAKMRTRTVGGATEVIVRVNHPMETGQRVDSKTKQKIPAHFIQKLTFLLNGKEVAVVDLGIAISANPLIKIRVNNAKRGDRIRVAWTDNRGETGGNEIGVS